MDDMESLADVYRKKLDTEESKVSVIVSFYRASFDSLAELDDIKFFSNLIKLFGADRVFTAILTIASKRTVLPNSSRAYIKGSIRSVASDMFHGRGSSNTRSLDMSEFISRRVEMAKEIKGIEVELDD